MITYIFVIVAAALICGIFWSNQPARRERDEREDKPPHTM